MFDIWHEAPRYPSDMTDDRWRLIRPLFRQVRQVEGIAGPRCAQWSAPFSTSIEADVRGGCCPGITSLGKPCTAFARWKHDGI